MSDSDSDDISNFHPLVRKRRSAEQSPSDSDPQLPVFYSKRKPPNHCDVTKLLIELKGSVDQCKEEMTEIRRSTTEQATMQAKGLLYQTLTSVFTCIVCSCVVSLDSEPVVPPWCRGVILCIVQWLGNSNTCPHYRHPLELEECLPQPLLHPLFDVLENRDN